MALTQISFPAEGASDWTAHIDMFKDLILGYIQCSLTEWDTGTVPQLAAGSKVELNGSYYYAGSNQSISGTPSSDYINYIYLDATAYTLSWSTTPPTWSDAKQGWYNGNDRCLGGCGYDGTNYYHKWIYDDREKIKRFVIEIGVWNMVDDSAITVNHYLGHLYHYVIEADATIQRDDNGNRHKLDEINSTTDGDTAGGIKAWTEWYFTLNRVTGGTFDTTDFNQESGYNRGWVIFGVDTIP